MNEPNQEQYNVLFKGTASAPGLAFGPVFIYNPSDLILSDEKISTEEIRTEQARVESAIRVVELETRKLEQLSKDSDLDEQSVAILEFQRSVLKDPELLSSINQYIRSDYFTADRAIYEAFSIYIERLKTVRSAYFRERVPDIREIRDRMIRTVQQKQLMLQIEQSSIVVCRDLSPGDIILFARKKVKALVSEQGGLTSHASIIANSMGIPFVIGVDGILGLVESGDIIVVNGTEGTITLNPDEHTILETQERIKLDEELESRRKLIAAEPGRTACGRRIHIQANVELETELDRVVSYKAEGIGLLRTEAYFLDNHQNENGHNGYTDRDQRSFLERAGRVCSGQNLTIRLFDVGGDKLPSYAKEEANPFLGWRGVRILLDKPVLLRNQLELIMSTLAESTCKLSILVPMISSIDEVKQVRKVYDEVLENYPSLKPSIQFGIMIEVPSAAILADKLAPLVDFFSIGTNDLTQYTLAADRTNRLVQSLFNQMHPSVWRLIHMTCTAAKAYQKPVSVCGELAGSTVAAALLVGMGVERLSMNATAIPTVKEFLRQYEFEYLKNKTDRILQASSISEVEEIVQEVLKKIK